MDVPSAGIAQPQSAPQVDVVHERLHVAARPLAVLLMGVVVAAIVGWHLTQLHRRAAARELAHGHVREPA